MITTLTVVNDMLGLLGERHINDLSEPHPMVPDALSKLSLANTTVQADLWWFNVEYPTLIPQANTGHILLPNDTAACDSLTQYPRLAVRGNKLYNLDDVTDVFTEHLRVRLHRILPFEHCPIQARVYISAKAKLDFQKDYDGDTAKAQILMRDIAESYSRMHAEHIRNANSNLLYKPSTAIKLMDIVGHRRPWQYGALNRRI